MCLKKIKPPVGYKERPSKNEILRRNLPLWRCSKAEPMCIFALNCRFSIGCFVDGGDANKIAVCRSRPTLKRLQPKPCLMIPIFEE